MSDTQRTVRHMADRQAARVKIDVRLRQDGIDKVDLAAADRGITRSEMIRILVAYSIGHMPDSYGRAL